MLYPGLPINSALLFELLRKLIHEFMIGYLLIDLWLSFTSIRTAYADELSLDKEQSSYNDLLDALRLSLKGYNIK